MSKECTLNINQVYMEAELPQSCRNCFLNAVQEPVDLLEENTSFHPPTVQQYGELVITSTLGDHEFGNYLGSERHRTLANDEDNKITISDSTLTTYEVESIKGGGVEVTYTREIVALCLLAVIDKPKKKDETTLCPLPVGGLFWAHDKVSQIPEFCLDRCLGDDLRQKLIENQIPEYDQFLSDDELSAHGRPGYSDESLARQNISAHRSHGTLHECESCGVEQYAEMTSFTCPFSE